MNAILMVDAAEILSSKLLLGGHIVVVHVSVLRIAKVHGDVRVTHSAVMVQLLHVVLLSSVCDPFLLILNLLTMNLLGQRSCLWEATHVQCAIGNVVTLSFIFIL